MSDVCISIMRSCIARTISFVASVAYLAFAIKALANQSNSHIRGICPGSTMWSALVVQCVLVVNGIHTAYKKPDDDEADGLQYAVHLMTYLAVAIWSMVECLSACVRSHLEDSAVRWFSLGWSIAVVGVVVLGLFALVGFAISAARAAVKEGERPRLQSQIEEDGEAGESGEGRTDDPFYVEDTSPTTVAVRLDK